MTQAVSAKKGGLFYGWWIVLSAFMFMFVFAGFAVYAFSLFVKPLAMDMGYGRGQLMLGLTIFMLLMGFASPFVGRLVDKMGARMIMTAGGIIMGLGFVILSAQQGVWMYYLGYIVLGIGVAGFSQVPCGAVVANWFKKKRGTASGIMSAGVGAGGIIMAPLIGSYLIPNFGWRTTYFILAVATWVIIIPLAMFVMRTRPADKGLYPDGDPAPTEAEAAAARAAGPSKGLTQKEAFGTAAFWLIAIAFLTSGFPQLGILQNQVPHLTDIGFNIGLAAGALGVVGLFSAIGKFVFGWICDFIPVKWVTIIGLVFQLVGILIFISITPSTPVFMLYVYAVLFGLGVGSWLPVLIVLIGQNFGLVAFGSIMGMLTLLQTIGSATGPLVAGTMYDVTGTYRVIFIIFAVLYAIAIPCILFLRRPRQMG